jgi:hypothetical protein
MKSALLNHKMMNKFNAVSNPIFDSYKWELTRDVKLPKDPKAYKHHLMNQLNVSSSNLVGLFIKTIDQKKDKKSTAKK